jgi:hypothetical protein
MVCKWIDDDHSSDGILQAMEGMSAGLCVAVERLPFSQNGIGFESNTTVVIGG